jgi:Rrf2 family protein
MIKLNRTTEYGLMALRHMNQKSKDGSEFTSAREVADAFGLPFEITAKTLQRMKETGLIQSAQGARGGYILQRKLEEITLAEFLDMMEGPQGVVACSSHAPVEAVAAQENACGCAYHGKCEIRGFMSNLNTKVRSFLTGIRLTDLSDSDFRSNFNSKDALEP